MNKYLLLLITLLLCSCTSDAYKEKIITLIEDVVIAAKEEAYLQGQKDAIEGDIRITKNPDDTWAYTKSPWDECGYDVKCRPDLNLKAQIDSANNAE
jgi:hypothetical protein